MLGLIVGSFLNVVIYRLPIMLEREWRSQAAELLSSGRSEHRSTNRARPPRAFHLKQPPLRLPPLQGANQGLAEHPGDQLAVAARACASCKADLRPLPAGGTGDRHSVRLGGLAFRIWRARGLRPARDLGIARAQPASTSIINSARQHHLAVHVGRPPGVYGPRSVGGAAVPVSTRDALIGAASGYISLWLVFHLFRLVTGKEGMGYGDFKLFAALGAWLGWKMLPLVIVLSAATGAYWESYDPVQGP